eukprot:scaffold224891_cov36-Tisochrysis_lutea.AAC.2
MTEAPNVTMSIHAIHNTARSGMRNAPKEPPSTMNTMPAMASATSGMRRRVYCAPSICSSGIPYRWRAPICESRTTRCAK